MYGGEILPNVIADYSLKMKEADNALNLATSSGDTDERTQSCIDSFHKLKEIYLELIACQPDLNELREKAEQKRYNEKRHFCLLIASIVVAIIFGVFAVLQFFFNG